MLLRKTSWRKEVTMKECSYRRGPARVKYGWQRSRSQKPVRAEIGLQSRAARMCLTVGTLTQKLSSAADYQFSTRPVRGDMWLNCWGMCTFTDHYVLYGLSQQRKLKLQKVLIKAPSFFYNSGLKAGRSDGGFLWELAVFLSWSWYGHGFGREPESLTGVFTVSYSH